MAAEPTRIKLKRSTTATVVPTTSNLTDGEVAVNIADRKIYVNNSGSIVEIANQKPNTGEVTTAMLATDITNGAGNTYYVASTGSDVTTLGNAGANGKHPDTPFLTVTKALSVATSGDTINIAAGTYQEVFPLTVPDGVTVRGTNLRSTQIYPTSGTNDLNAFVLEGDSHVSDLTVKDFFYNSGNDTGYGFVCASSLDSERSPYIERVTVLTKGSVTSASDPYGFAQGDAGRGAKLDGAQFSSNSIEAAILFNEVTFIVPNSVGLFVTNGVRVEWLNSFVYFAAEGLKGVQGSTGRAGAGQTRLKLSGVSGTFSASEIIYQLQDNFQSGTYSRSGTTVTVTKNSHGCQNGDVIYADFISGSGTDGYYTVANVAANTFEITDTASGTTSGNITYKKANAYGTIASNDGTYLFINGKGVGEFTTGVPTGKTGVIAGDAQLDTAQKKFGTASLLLDGTTDHLNYPTAEDFGFGTTNWAAECFIRPAAVTGTQYFLDFRDASATDTAPSLYLNGTTLHFAVGNTSQISGGTLSANTWYHVAVARNGGTTRLFLDGTLLGTYSDSNDYGSTKPLGIGGQYSGVDEFGGHIDEIRVSKAASRYTGAFTAPTSAFTTDLFTVLLLHFDGTDGSTTITDSGKGVRDIRSSGGDSATSLLTADYAQFGAELRSISSANIYGTKGAIADGAGVKLLLTAHNFAYIGSGADFTNDPDLAVPANEVTETNGGRIFYSATNEKGDFRIGDAFIVDQETGNVQFQSTSTAQEAANITLTDATGTTRIFPAFVETGNLRLSGNTLSSTSGNVILDPSADEDIVLNAEVITTEGHFYNNSKLVSHKSPNNSSVNTELNGTAIQKVSSGATTSYNNLLVQTRGIGTISIDVEGGGYPGGSVNVDVGSDPFDAGAATAVLETNGQVKTVVITNPGSGFSVNPTISTSPSPADGGGDPNYTITRAASGRWVSYTLQVGGSGYTAGAATISAPQEYTFSTDLSVASATDSIAIGSTPFAVNDRVVYDKDGGSVNIGLTDGTTYYIKEVDPSTQRVKLSATQGGSVINLTVSGTSETHKLKGVQATATCAVDGSGAVTSVTITDQGTGYDSSLTVTPAGGGSGLNGSATVGSGVISIQADSGGKYSSAPNITITPNQTDSSWATNGAATTTLGYSIASITLTDPGRGYVKLPSVSITGGSPLFDAAATITFDETTGILTGLTLVNVGEKYDSTPTVTLTGGSGSGGRLSLDIQSVDGTIAAGGSGYAPGTYSGVQFTGGSALPGNLASADFTVVGLGGNLTGGSGYVDNNYTGVTLRNNPTTTYTVTVVNRLSLSSDVNSLSGTFNVGDTVTGATSGASGVITGTVIDSTTYNQAVVYFSSISGGPFTDGETINSSSGGSLTLLGTGAQGTADRYVINGTETPILNLVRGNTYKFDMSDASNNNHPLTFLNIPTNQNGGDEIRVSQVGVAGSPNAFSEVIVKTYATSTPFDYGCVTHGIGMGRVGGATTSAGSTGTYGDSATVDVTVSGGVVTSLSFTDQGSDYGVGQTVYIDLFQIGDQGGGTYSGSGMSFAINTNDTSISSVSNISLNGSGYAVGDTLSVDDANVGSGGGSGFQFNVSKAGFLKAANVGLPGRNFTVGDSISVPPTVLDNGSGTDFTISVGTVTESNVFRAGYEGDFTGENFQLLQDGSFDIQTNKFNIDGPTGNTEIAGTLGVGGNTQINGTLNVVGNVTFPNNIVATGSDNDIDNANIKLQDGTELLPTLGFQNSSTTGLYRAGADDIGLTISGVQRGSISATGVDLSTDLVVDQNLTETVPFFKVDATGETLTIGAAATQLRVNNDASIESVGTDTNIDISINPKGTGNLIFTGGASQKLSLTDGTDEKFSVETDTGRVDGVRFVVDSVLDLTNGTIGNTSSVATSSFGSIATFTLTGTGTGYTPGNYTNVSGTGSASGTGAEFTVAVDGAGNITTLTISAAGSNYVELETITLDAAVVGSGSGQTIKVTRVEGFGIRLKPSSNKDVWMDTNSSLIIPAGTTNERPVLVDRKVGAVRFNTTQLQFEGYNGSDFVSLGGVRDVNQDTYILTEQSPGSNEDTFFFYNQGVNSLDIVQDKFKLYTAKTFDTSGTLTLNGIQATSDPLKVSNTGTNILTVRWQGDVQVDGALRLKSVPSQGGVASIGTVTSTSAAYTPSQALTGLVSSGQFEGTGATFDVTVDGSGNVTGVTPNNPGTRYAVGEIITIDGSLLGGQTPANDITFPVATISNARNSFARLDVLQQEFVTSLDDKPFVNLDSNGAEALWRINKGWNAGAETYLTVFDSTAKFMELDDCRLEGGQLSSFGASSTIVQFDKTTFKGAKTLVTVESDDGKVHMLEVTSVCAASGTTAYATITNSVTSSNDLVDADVVVVGNNVQVSLTKSTAATSSTSFTGRFTTTKVKV